MDRKKIAENPIVQVLMDRDGLSLEEAHNRMMEAWEDFEATLGQEDFDIDQFLADEFGLEPDYLFDFLDYPVFVS